MNYQQDLLRSVLDGLYVQASRQRLMEWLASRRYEADPNAAMIARDGPSKPKEEKAPEVVSTVKPALAGLVAHPDLCATSHQVNPRFGRVE